MDGPVTLLGDRLQEQEFSTVSY